MWFKLLASVDDMLLAKSGQVLVHKRREFCVVARRGPRAPGGQALPVKQLSRRECS